VGRNPAHWAARVQPLNKPDPAEVPDRQPVSGARKGPGARLAVLYGAMVLFLLAVFGLEKPRGLLEVTLHDLREVFFFGFAALVILELTALLGRRWIRKRSLYYAVALVAVAGLVIGYEMLVEAHPDDPWRGARSLVGAFAFLALSAGLDRALKREHAWLRGWPRRSVTIAAALLIVSVLNDLGPVMASYAGRSGAFPVVVDLASSWQEPFIEVSGAELFVGRGPEEWSRRAGRRVAVLMFDGSPGGGVTVEEPFKDWSGFDGINLHLFSTAPRPIRMILRLDDRSREPEPEERVAHGLQVMPGPNDFHVPLEAISTTPSGRTINLATVRRFGLYLGEPAEPFRIYLHRVRIAEQ
jgi:hypothetical protein